MSKDKNQSPEIMTPEWSVLVDVQPIGNAAEKIRIEAGSAERKALAKRLGVVSLDALSADLKLKRDMASGSIHVKGKLSAEITQGCVITGEPVQNTVKEDFEAWFADKAQALSFARARHDRLKKAGGAERPLLDESEDPEPVIDGKIDLGELTVQYLSLGIDPYPHCEGAALPEPAAKKAEKAESPYKNPFAALKDWKNRLDSENT